MEFYLTQFIYTIIIAFLSYILWKRTGHVAVLVGAGALYYWSLYGAWFLIYDLRGGDSGAHYYYLLERLFSIRLNRDYLLTLFMYFVFIVSVLGTAILAYKSNKKKYISEKTILFEISHIPLILLASLAGIGSYFVVSDYLYFAYDIGASGYVITRSAATREFFRFFSIHQVLTSLSLMSLTIGFSIALAGSRAKYISGNSTVVIKIAYVCMLAAMYLFCVLLGNKNELLYSLLTGVLFYIANTKEKKLWIILAVIFIGLSFIALIDYARGFPLHTVGYAFTIPNVWRSLMSVMVSNEAFCSHFSLYGIINHDVHIVYGESFWNLILSVIPRVVWPERPYSVYGYYVMSVKAILGQGYTLHHASGWYLNFGYAGIILGGSLLGLIWARLLNGFNRIAKHKRFWKQAFFLIAPWSFSAYFPQILRAGPEAYKGLFVEAFFIPTVLLLLSAKRAQEITSSESKLEMHTEETL